ncbi:MAG: mechanosensitive ion channel family protein [Candidatus Komeilibacteria bacterium]
MDFLSFIFWGNSIQEYLVALAILIGAVIVFRVFKLILVARLKKIAKKTSTDYDDAFIAVLNKITWLFYLVLSAFIAMQFLNVGDRFDRIANYVFVIVFGWQVIKSILVVVDFILHKALSKGEEEPDAHKIDLFSKLIKIIVWVVGLVLVISNLGYDVTALIAGLGVGGIAIAFALQNVLEDIFSSFSIYLDQPFKIGDYIVVGKEMGTVTKIGIKTTRLLSVQGEEVVVSNKELTNAHIQNYRKIKERRTQFDIGVAYETSNDKLKKIPDIIKKIISDNKDCRFERCTFKEFADFSLNYDIVFHYSDNDYNKYLLAREQINLNIKSEFEKEGIEFAYPTQTVIVKK